MGKSELVMELVKVKFGHAWEISQTDDYTRQVVPKEEVTETVVWMDCEIELRGLSQGFAVIGRIREKDFDTERLAAKVRAAVLIALRKRRIWDLFKPSEIIVAKADAENSTNEAEGEIDNLAGDKYEGQAKIGNAAWKRWKAAIEQAQEALRFPQHSKSELSAAISCVDRCTQAASIGLMGGWCAEKMAYLRSGMADLAARKNPNHPRYTQIVSDMRGWLSHWPVTNTWHQHPPSC